MSSKLHLGKRGRVLLFFGCLDIIYAFSLAAPDGITRDGQFFSWLSEIMPMAFWSTYWAVVGVICVWQAFCRRDKIGFTAATFLKIGWGIVCLGGWIAGGVERGYVSAAIWLGLAYLVSSIAGWAEPGDTKGPTWKPPSL